jgi:hypothetical protein
VHGQEAGRERERFRWSFSGAAAHRQRGAQLVKEKSLGGVIVPQFGPVEAGIGIDNRIAGAGLFVGLISLVGLLFRAVLLEVLEREPLDAKQQAAVGQAEVGFDGQFDDGGLLAGVG